MWTGLERVRERDENNRMRSKVGTEEGERERTRGGKPV